MPILFASFGAIGIIAGLVLYSFFEDKNNRLSPALPQSFTSTITLSIASKEQEPSSTVPLIPTPRGTEFSTASVIINLPVETSVIITPTPQTKQVCVHQLKEPTICEVFENYDLLCKGPYYQIMDCDQINLNCKGPVNEIDPLLYPPNILFIVPTIGKDICESDPNSQWMTIPSSLIPDQE